MKAYNLILAAALILTAVSCEPNIPSNDNPGNPDIPSVTPGDGNIVMQWENEPQRVCPGAYARVHRLNDGRYMLVYSSGSDGYLRFSTDGCLTWSQPSKVFIAKNFTSEAGVNVANAEFAQLSADNPHRPNRIIYAANLRPKNKKTTKTPYSIAIITSDDNGVNWSGINEIYASRTWSSDIEKGCYEPFVLELPDGTVQIYFADETPYYKDGLHYQNISVMESSDGGDTWTKTPRVVSYNSRCRDGMPVAMLLKDKIYVAIEENGLGHPHFRPKIVYSDVVDNWKMPVLSTSAYRFNPLMTPIDSDSIYAGAPYLIHTDNYLALAYLSSDGAAEPGSKKRHDGVHRMRTERDDFRRQVRRQDAREVPSVHHRPDHRPRPLGLPLRPRRRHHPRSHRMGRRGLDPSRPHRHRKALASHDFRNL